MLAPVYADDAEPNSTARHFRIPQRSVSNNDSTINFAYGDNSDTPPRAG
ncbi:MAG: hypothetical protein IPL86_11765 [Flavobacteriales bacterium]|nr:hypothetical protein [Flavobacteriales bacterium]